MKKILIATILLILVVLGISVYESHSESSQPITVKKAPTSLDKETLDYFLEVAMKNEFGSQRATLIKWIKSEVTVRVDGTADSNATECLNKVIEDFNGLSTTTKLKLAYDKADIDIYFAPESEFKSIESNYEPVNLGYFWFKTYSDGTIYSSKVLIDNTSRVNDQERCHLIREELTQTMGLVNDSNKYPDSMFYAPWTATNHYSLIDESLIKALYATDIKPGLTTEEVISYFSPH